MLGRIENDKKYQAPMAEVIVISVSHILCQSGGNTNNGNERMEEEDLGSGGFQ